jgi:hypothetical protein
MLGSDEESARQWWVANDRKTVRTEDLDPDAPLGQALPVYATARGSRTAFQQKCRIAHNHWVCDLLTERVPSSGRKAWALGELQALIESRSRSTRWGLQAALEVVAGAAP